MKARLLALLLCALALGTAHAQITDSQIPSGTVKVCNTPASLWPAWIVPYVRFNGSTCTIGVTQNGMPTVPPVTVAYSATPAFVATNSLQTITLTGNVTSSTISAIAAGQRVAFQICQDATGSRTFVWPTAVHGGMTIGATASTCSQQEFLSFSGTTLVAITVGTTNIAP